MLLLLQIPKVYCHAGKILTLNPVLNHCNPFHNLSPCFYKIHLNAIPRSTSGSPTLSLSSMFLYRQYVYFFHCSRTHYITDISRPQRFDHSNRIWWKIQILKLLAVQFPILCYYFTLSESWSISFGCLFRDIVSLWSLLSTWDTRS
jgi:hypothetical protein